MAAIKISEGIYSVGVLNPSMRIFDVVMKTEFGTSYNAYLITGEKNILVETVHLRFFDEYIDNIKSVIDPSKIDYLIMNHNEPDHSGSIDRLFEIAPQIQVLTSPAGKIYLPHITNRPDLALKAVKDGETLDIGGGRELKFIHAPFLHWPDSMFTWLESEKTVFTCDFFGTHFCEPTMLDSKIKYMDYYMSSFKVYFDAIFGPFKPYVQKGLSKLSELSAETVCTSHGPILQKGVLLEYAIEKYNEWSSPEENKAPYIPVFFCSAYGNTGRLADKIAEGIKSVLNSAVVEAFDVNECNLGELIDKLNESSAFLVGSPTINKDAVPPIWELLSGIDAINCKDKPASAFGSYGWSGEALPALISRLKMLKLNVFEEGLTCRFVPSEEEVQKAFDFGARFAETVK